MIAIIAFIAAHVSAILGFGGLLLGGLGLGIGALKGSQAKAATSAATATVAQMQAEASGQDAKASQETVNALADSAKNQQAAAKMTQPEVIAALKQEGGLRD